MCVSFFIVGLSLVQPEPGTCQGLTKNKGEKMEGGGEQGRKGEGSLAVRARRSNGRESKVK